MRVLVACEESQRVCIEFRKLGHEAYSCDVIDPSGGHPEWHIKGDALEVINPAVHENRYKGFGSFIGIQFFTMDGEEHEFSGKWDLIIAHPPCTDLAVSGARYFAEKRADGRQRRSIDFFMAFVNADCERIAIENPIGIMSTKYRKPDQIIQPYMFGHGETKATCLWLKGLSALHPTQMVDGREQRIWKMSPSPERAKMRSKTFPGIARAMAEQWGGKEDGKIR